MISIADLISYRRRTELLVTNLDRCAATAVRSCAQHSRPLLTRNAAPSCTSRATRAVGIGLLHKLQAYGLQDAGHDTVDANLKLGLPADAPHYGTGAQILADLGIRSMRPMTNNPAKRAGLEGYGLRIGERIPLEIHPNERNLAYLHTKAGRMGHQLGMNEAFASSGA